MRAALDAHPRKRNSRQERRRTARKRFSFCCRAFVFRLSFRELEAFASAWLPGFLTLFHPRIAGQATAGFQHFA